MRMNLKNSGKYSLKARYAFTLIEILVVVSIIIILLGAVVAIGSNIRNSSYTKATYGILHTLGQCSKAFREATGQEVSGNYLSDFKNVPECLKMINRLPSQNVTSNNVLDAWGSVIIYHSARTETAAVAAGATPLSNYPANGLPDGYFQSIGPDGIPNNTDDLRNTEATN